MQRFLLILALLLSVLSVAGAAPLTDEQRAASLDYIHSLQNEDGGYRIASAVGASQLDATTNSLRALHYLQGETKDRRSLGLFVLSCYDPITGGFSDTPGGMPDVHATARGLMALAELKQAKSDRATKAAAYLLKHAQELPDRYLALAAFEAAAMKHPETAAWTAAWEATAQPGGTYGKGVMDTAGAVVALSRLGATVKDRDAVVRALKGAQRPDGGFLGAEAVPNLPAAYRITRALMILKEKPDVEKLRGFIARCRNADGGYAHHPGEPSNPWTTYMAAIVHNWLDELEK